MSDEITPTEALEEFAAYALRHPEEEALHLLMTAPNAWYFTINYNMRRLYEDDWEYASGETLVLAACFAAIEAKPAGFFTPERKKK